MAHLHGTGSLFRVRLERVHTAHVFCGLCIAVNREWISSKYDVCVDEMGRMWTGQSPESQRQPFSHSALKIKTPVFQISPIRHILLDTIPFTHTHTYYTLYTQYKHIPTQHTLSLQSRCTILPSFLWYRIYSENISILYCNVYSFIHISYIYIYVFLYADFMTSYEYASAR